MATLQQLAFIDAEHHVDEAIGSLEESKPNDRSALDRKIAIIITELEKVKALINSWSK